MRKSGVPSVPQISMLWIRTSKTFVVEQFTWLTPIFNMPVLLSSCAAEHICTLCLLWITYLSFNQIMILWKAGALRTRCSSKGNLITLCSLDLGDPMSWSSQLAPDRHSLFRALSLVFWWTSLVVVLRGRSTFLTSRNLWRVLMWSSTRTCQSAWLPSRSTT